MLKRVERLAGVGEILKDRREDMLNGAQMVARGVRKILEGKGRQREKLKEVRDFVDEVLKIDNET